MPDVTRQIPVAEALAALRAGTAPPAPRTLAVRGALGLVAAETVVAPSAMPSGWLARRDGIAVASGDLVGASAYAPVLLPQAPPLVRAGQPLPAGADAVLPADAAAGAGGLVEIGQPAHPGENAIAAGADLAAGEPILAPGLIVTPAHRLALEAAGIADIRVRVPRIAMVPGVETPALRWLAAQIEACGCRLASPSEADLVVLGGDSGRDGHTIALRPGFCRLVSREGRSRLALPPLFDGVVAAFYALLLPLIAGLTARRPALVARPLTRKVSSMVGSTDLVLLRETAGGFEPLAVGEAPLLALMTATAVALVPPESEGSAAGMPLDALLLHHPLASDQA